MSDATLPPPRSSSEASASTDGNRSDSSNGDGDGDSGTSLIQAESLTAKGEGEGDGEGKADSKQKRKRTRYVLGVVAHRRPFLWFPRRIYRTWVQLEIQYDLESIANIFSPQSQRPSDSGSRIQTQPQTKQSSTCGYSRESRLE